MRTLKVDLQDILDLVVCADDYGHTNDVLMSSLAEFTGVVSYVEIEEFAKELGSQDGYGEEDEEEARARLTQWRIRYLQNMRQADADRADDGSTAEGK